MHSICYQPDFARKGASASPGNEEVELSLMTPRPLNASRQLKAPSRSSESAGRRALTFVMPMPPFLGILTVKGFSKLLTTTV